MDDQSWLGARWGAASSAAEQVCLLRCCDGEDAPAKKCKPVASPVLQHTLCYQQLVLMIHIQDTTPGMTKPMHGEGLYDDEVVVRSRGGPISDDCLLWRALCACNASLHICIHSPEKYSQCKHQNHDTTVANCPRLHLQVASKCPSLSHLLKRESFYAAALLRCCGILFTYGQAQAGAIANFLVRLSHPSHAGPTEMRREADQQLQQLVDVRAQIQDNKDEIRQLSSIMLRQALLNGRQSIQQELQGVRAELQRGLQGVRAELQQGFPVAHIDLRDLSSQVKKLTRDLPAT